MTADWTVCRDRAGHLLSATEISTAMHLTGPRAGIRIHVGRLDEFGPFVPILDADGMPVVRTVGDLTARHIGRLVRVDYGGGEAEVIIVERVKHYGYGTNLGAGCGYLDLDTTCELLP